MAEIVTTYHIIEKRDYKPQSGDWIGLCMDLDYKAHNCCVWALDIEPHVISPGKLSIDMELHHNINPSDISTQSQVAINPSETLIDKSLTYGVNNYTNHLTDIHPSLAINASGIAKDINPSQAVNSSIVSTDVQPHDVIMNPHGDIIASEQTTDLSSPNVVNPVNSNQLPTNVMPFNSINPNNISTDEHDVINHSTHPEDIQPNNVSNSNDNSQSKGLNPHHFVNHGDHITSVLIQPADLINPYDPSTTDQADAVINLLNKQQTHNVTNHGEDSCDHKCYRLQVPLGDIWQVCV